jgi:glycosyltransferase involved in cell wall biosynthesis
VARAVTSARDAGARVAVIDSGSTDATVQIAESLGATVFTNPWPGYAEQRNWALDAIRAWSPGWVFYLDADEVIMPALAAELKKIVAAPPTVDGYLVKRRLIWMGQWIKRGYYPVWLLRVFRYGAGRWEARSVNEHAVVDGATGRLEHDILHDDARGISAWSVKHVAYAAAEAREFALARAASDGAEASLFGTPTQRTRWLRERVFHRAPLLLRPWLLFGYRYVIRGGFLDGRAAFTYHFLQSLWFWTLVDVMHIEERDKIARSKPAP